MARAKLRCSKCAMRIHSRAVERSDSSRFVETLGRGANGAEGRAFAFQRTSQPFACS
jgi:hypothetical protein